MENFINSSIPFAERRFISVKILAHRGYWNKEISKNSSTALKQAIDHGYGFESDIRDYAGKLVISHNPANENNQDAAEIFHWLAEQQDRFCFAINIKADGLGELLLEQIEKNQIKNYFAFDMSVPQMVEYDNLGLKYFTRQSEIETIPVMYEKASGIWLDGFWGTDWITEELLNRHIECNKKICIVSPELHKREFKIFWNRLKEFRTDFSQILLCTDYPVEAKDIFKDLAE